MCELATAFDALCRTRRLTVARCALQRRIKLLSAVRQAFSHFIVINTRYSCLPRIGQHKITAVAY